MYEKIDKPEVMRGIKAWKNPGNKFNVIMLHYTADPDKDPERNGKKWYEREREGTPKDVWNKEYEISFETKAGKLVYGPEYCDFTPEKHLINSFELGNVELMLSLDFGQRNPNAALVGAVTENGDVYIIDEYYKPAIPSVASREMFDKFGYLIPGYKEGLSFKQKRTLADNAFQIKVIDPSTTSKNRTKIIEGEEIPYSVIEDFYDNGWDFKRGINDWDAGVTRVREYFRLDSTGKPRLYIFQDKCPNLTWELLHYRYQENTEQTERKKNESERPMKKDDHAADSLRYLLMERPFLPTESEPPQTRVQKDIENLTKPKNYVNDWDLD